ncbi:MAG: hypothetical protein ACREBU_00520 [Nitrososphaera sp.]
MINWKMLEPRNLMIIMISVLIWWTFYRWIDGWIDTPNGANGRG